METPSNNESEENIEEVENSIEFALIQKSDPHNKKN